jgi:hypothetical protein
MSNQLSGMTPALPGNDADNTPYISPETISILGLEDSEPGRPDRWTLKRPDDWRLGRVEVPLEIFRQRVAGFVDSVREVITGLPEAVGKYQLDQVTVTAEVSAKGQISLLGSGGEIAGKSGLTFTFTRQPDLDGQFSAKPATPS